MNGDGRVVSVIVVASMMLVRMVLMMNVLPMRGVMFVLTSLVLHGFISCHG